MGMRRLGSFLFGDSHIGRELKELVINNAGNIYLMLEEVINI
jgi:hypothetical protein